MKAKKLFPKWYIDVTIQAQALTRYIYIYSQVGDVHYNSIKSYPAAKHPKHKKLNVANIREQPVFFGRH